MAPAAQLRLLRLELAIRLRRLGLWPWVMLLAWSLFASGQEPRLLRAFGIYLGPQGTWSGATILLMALSASFAPRSGGAGLGLVELRQGARTSVAIAVGLVTGTGLVHAASMILGDLVVGDRVGLLPALQSGSFFAVAMLPAAAAVTCLGPLWSRSLTARFGLGVVVCYSLCLSSVCFSVPSVATATASILATFGALAASAAIRASDS